MLSVINHNKSLYFTKFDDSVEEDIEYNNAAYDDVLSIVEGSIDKIIEGADGYFLLVESFIVAGHIINKTIHIEHIISIDNFIVENNDD